MKKNLTLAFFSPFYLISSSLRNLLSPSVNISFLLQEVSKRFFSLGPAICINEFLMLCLIASDL